MHMTPSHHLFYITESAVPAFEIPSQMPNLLKHI